MTKKKKLKFAEKARRDQELEKYGKLVSLRPGITHKSRKDYNRQEFKKIDYEN